MPAVASDKINLDLSGFSKWWVVGSWNASKTPMLMAVSLTDAVAMTGQVQTTIEQRAKSFLGDTGVAGGSAPDSQSIWMRVVGGTATRDTTASALGYQLSSWGAVMGADQHLTPHLLVGGAFSFSRGFTNGLDGLEWMGSRVNSAQINGYGAWSHRALLVTGELGVGFNDYRESRALSDQTLTAGYSGIQYALAAGIDYAIPFKGWVLTPTAGLRWLHLDTDSYREQGGSAAASAGADSQNQVEGQLGAKVALPLNLKGHGATAEFKAAWVHDFVNGDIALTRVIGGVSFIATGALPQADGALLATGLTLAASDGLSLRAAYEGQFRSDYRAHTGLLEMKAGF